jgi:hypothetical protein
MKVLIAGSRNLQVSNNTMLEDLNEFLDDINAGFVSTIISGGATGIDKCGESLAESLGVPVKQYLPNWKKEGKKAGPLRNKEMVDACDAALIYYDGKSKGTLSTINFLKKTTKPYLLIMIEEETTNT